MTPSELRYAPSTSVHGLWRVLVLVLPPALTHAEIEAIVQLLVACVLSAVADKPAGNTALAQQMVVCLDCIYEA